MNSELGKIQVSQTAKGLKKYRAEVRHRGLNKYQVIRGDDEYVVQQKARVQMRQWDGMWAARQKREQKRSAGLLKKEQAVARTKEAKAALSALENILAHTLQVDDKVNWESLKDRSRYPVPAPKRPVIPLEPQEDDKKYQVKFGFLDRLFAARRREKKQAATAAFQAEHALWQQRKEAEEARYTLQLEEHKKNLAAFVADQTKTNAAIDEQKRDYLSGEDIQAIVDYCDLVLTNSQYPDYFPQSYELDYNPESKMLVVDYQLPPLNNIPTVREVGYVQTRDAFTEKHISQVQLNRLYDNLLYQIALRTVHELYEADQIDALAIIVFNGYVDSVDQATGQEQNACILSLQAGKSEFQQINLARVDPKACFKSLKGVGSSKLYSLTPIAPILRIEREDSRFVSSYAVAHNIQAGDNLALMDWEDFEHLIREIFEKEFAVSGGEVKVTQASRDGGVDAVIFDPDPLRGGNIVVQAKRYSNTVGVSAVRDLYGTIMNEGANKGILVTTSDYGPDAYEFAKGKPIVLLNGGNLLHLLEKHGHRARIDLKEAKQIMGKGSS